jgi:predicted HD superfamily hydrolase involved in NAD metabolism
MKMRLPERQALTAALLHDCAKNLDKDSPYLQGFVLDPAWGDVPPPVLHQFTGAYVAERSFGVQDQEVLNAIRYHTSGRENMSPLEKLVFLADMLEDGRAFEGVEELRRLFWEETDVDICLKAALARSLEFIKEKGEKIYPLTEAAYRYVCAQVKR